MSTSTHTASEPRSVSVQSSGNSSGNSSGRTRVVRRGLVPRRFGASSVLFGPIVVLLLWQLASSVGLLSPRVLASPLAAIQSGYEMLMDGTLQSHLLASAGRAYAGLFIGVTLGLVLALVAGLTGIGDASIDGLVQVKRAVPTLALIPLAIMWLGIGEVMKIALIAGSVLVPVYINTHAALRGIDIRYVELARTLGLSRREFIRRVALPGALPGFFTGLRLAVTTCWTALVVLEQINTTQGVGYLMSRARDYGQTEIIVVGLFIYAVLGIASDAAVRAWARKTLGYQRVIGS